MKQFGSIENLLQNTTALKGKLKEKVETNGELAVQSKRLATIMLDVPVTVVPDDLYRREWNKEQLRDLFAELEFRRMSEQLGLTAPAKTNAVTEKKATSSSQQASLFDQVEEVKAVEEDAPVLPSDLKTIQDVTHHYHCVKSETELDALLEKLSNAKAFCFDTETTGLNALTAELVGMSFAITKHEGWYVPVPAQREEALKITDRFKAVFQEENIIKVAQNPKYDMTVLSNYGIEIKGRLFDTMIAHFLLRPEMRHSMDVLSETYLHYSPVSIETLIGKRGKDQLNMRDVPVEQVAEYAAEDADVTLQLFHVFEYSRRFRPSLPVRERSCRGHLRWPVDSFDTGLSRPT